MKRILVFSLVGGLTLGATWLHAEGREPKDRILDLERQWATAEQQADKDRLARKS
jgi:hypothetical protein